MPSTPRSLSAPRRNRQIGRRWVVPPAIMSDPDESLEGTLVLEDYPGCELGLLLWSALRDITLWASVSAEHRPGLFAPRTAEKRLESLARETSLETRAEILLASLTAVPATPHEVDQGSVCLACIELSKWAHGEGKLATAIAFAQAASKVDEADAHASLRVGMLAYEWATGGGSQWRRQRLARAETWLRRAVGQARRTRAWDAYALAYIDLGRISHQRDNPALANTYYLTAERSARRKGHLTIRAAALHGRFRVALSLHDYARAEPLAKAALRSYGRAAQPPDLLLEVAELWIGTGNYSGAMEALDRVLSTVEDAERRARLLSLSARAAAGAGDVEAYREAWSGAWMLLTRPGQQADVAFERTLVQLSRAAVVAEDRPRVAQAAGLLRQRAAASVEASAYSRLQLLSSDSDQNQPVRRVARGGL